jgi:7,8-dihydro-6-hydroxymethylpterin-pyrophosphokinase
VGGPPGQSNYLNAAAIIETENSPQAMLAQLQHIEMQLGRERRERWGERTLDLDLLLHDQCVLHSPSLVVPHPRLPFRRFVLTPAAEIAGDLTHPTTGFSIRELLSRLADRPIHVSVVAFGASKIARDAAGQVGGCLLQRPEKQQGGSTSPTETLEFLRQGVHDWEAAVSTGARAVISDFWLGEIWWELDQSATGGQEIQAAWRDAPRRLVAPHMVVWLEPASEQEARALNRPRRIVFQPRQFPVFTIHGSAAHAPLTEFAVTDVAVTEITAAVEAMQ